MSADPLQIVFGAMADPIRIQLRGKYLSLGTRDIGHLQKDADAVSRLAVRGLITDSAAHAARQKIMKKLSVLLTTQDPKP